MKTILSFFLVIVSGIIMAQDDYDLVSYDLGLDKMPFGNTMNGTINTEKIKNHYFREVDLIADQNNVLYKASYTFKSIITVDRFMDELKNILTSRLGEPTSSFENYDMNIWSFDTVDYVYKLTYYLGTIKKNSSFEIIKPVMAVTRSFDEFNNTTSLSIPGINQSVVTENNEELLVSFKGILDNDQKYFYMTVRSESNDWKFIDYIKLLLEDGTVYSVDLNPDRDVVNTMGTYYTKEVAHIQLNHEIMSKIQDLSKVKFRAVGRASYDFKLTPSLVKSFEILKHY